MKKQTIIAAALMLTTTHIAIAQSSATLYGTIDLGYGVGNAGAYEGNAGLNSKFQQWGSGKTTSVWGLKGEEALGSGHKVYFQLESAINPETGEGGDGDKLFSEVAIIGISGNFGSMQAGRQTTVSSNILGEFDVSGAPSFTSSLGNAGISGDSQRLLGDFHSTTDSALVYISPDFSGFSFQAGLVMKNDDIFDAPNVPIPAESKNIYTLGATYAIGDFLIGAAFESKPLNVSGVDISASWGIGAKYDFGSFLIAASYFDNHFKEDGKGFSLGVSVPINAFEVGAQIAYNTDARVGTEKVKPIAWELYSTYSMSQRTQLYAQYGGINNDARDFNGAARKYSAGFGIIHNF
ncbi:MAG: porin [Saezia sp.]